MDTQTQENISERQDGWKVIHEKTLFRGPFVEVSTVDTTSPTRRDPHTWTLIRRKPAASVVPILPDGRLLMLQQERIPVQDTLWEFPAGQIDESHKPTKELIRQTVLRELEEETGYTVPNPRDDLLEMGFFYTSQGFTNEKIYLFAARNVQDGENGTDLDHGEVIHEAQPFSPGEVRKMIAENEIRDGNSLALFCRLLALKIIDFPD